MTAPVIRRVGRRADQPGRPGGLGGGRVRDDDRRPVLQVADDHCRRPGRTGPLRRHPLRPVRGASLPHHRAAQAALDHGAAHLPGQLPVPAPDPGHLGPGGRRGRGGREHRGRRGRRHRGDRGRGHRAPAGDPHPRLGRPRPAGDGGGRRPSAQPAPQGGTLPGNTGGTLTTQRGASSVHLPTSSAAPAGAGAASDTMPAGEHGALVAAPTASPSAGSSFDTPAATQPAATAPDATSGTSSPAGETPPDHDADRDAAGQDPADQEAESRRSHPSRRSRSHRSRRSRRRRSRSPPTTKPTDHEAESDQEAEAATPGRSRLVRSSGHGLVRQLGLGSSGSSGTAAPAAATAAGITKASTPGLPEAYRPAG